MRLKEKQRANLHKQLDKLLDLREALPAGFSRRGLDKRQSLFEEACFFAGKVIGPKGFIYYFDDLERDDISEFLGRMMLVLLLVIPEDSPWRDIFADAAKEVLMLHHGDIPTLLAPAARPRGAHPKHRQISIMRSSAFLWDIHLAAHGVSLLERRQKIEQAFRTPWDTIRKWGKLPEKLHGEKHAAHLIAVARKGRWRYPFSNYQQDLTDEGERYWAMLNQQERKIGNATD